MGVVASGTVDRRHTQLGCARLDRPHAFAAPAETAEGRRSPNGHSEGGARTPDGTLILATEVDGETYRLRESTTGIVIWEVTVAG